MKHPDFKNVILKILDVSFCNGLAAAQGQYSMMHTDLGNPNNSFEKNTEHAVHS